MKVFFYNWEEIKKASKGKCNDIISLFGILSGYKKNFSRKHFEQAVQINNFRNKTSFVFNIEDLLSDKRSTTQEKCLVLFLGAKRNYATYLTNKDSSLPIMIVEDILDVNKLKNNPLLEIKGDFIHFKYN